MKNFCSKTMFLVASLMTLPVFAQETATVSSEVSLGAGLKFLSAGLAIGLAVIGAAQGQGQAAKGAIETVGRNPQVYNKVFTMFLLSMALIEFQAILGLIISFMILGK